MLWTVALVVSTLLVLVTALRSRWPRAAEEKPGLALAAWSPPQWASTHPGESTGRTDSIRPAPATPQPAAAATSPRAPPRPSSTAGWVNLCPPPVTKVEPTDPPAPRTRLPSLRSRVRKLEMPSPREIDVRLEKAGYRGQPEARRVASVLAYRHVRRLRRLYDERVSSSNLPPRDNLLLVGPTGCGKTHLVELIFREILQVPTVVVDITAFSETGYIGHDVSEIPGRLLTQAGEDLAWASCGVVCLDELDKLAGDATNGKDVSGFGVQRSLLTLLSAETIEASIGSGQNRRTFLLPLRGVTFIACGAFSGLETEATSRRQVGFGAERAPGAPDRVGALPELAQQTEALERYGFLPELIGRFTRIVTLDPLGLPELRSIADGLHGLYARDLAADGIDSDFSPEELDAVARRAVKRGTGARGLRAEMQRRLEELQYAGIGSNEGGLKR